MCISELPFRFFIYFLYLQALIQRIELKMILLKVLGILCHFIFCFPFQRKRKTHRRTPSSVLQDLVEGEGRDKPPHTILIEQLFSFIGSNPEKAVCEILVKTWFLFDLHVSHHVIDSCSCFYRSPRLTSWQQQRFGSREETHVNKHWFIWRNCWRRPLKWVGPHTSWRLSPLSYSQDHGKYSRHICTFVIN